MKGHLLDDRDIAILTVLSREGRISKTDLAQRVNLSVTPCWQRLKRLEQAGLIRGYRADVALNKIGANVVVFVMAELDSHKAENFQAFERAMDRYEEVTGCWALGGGYDYLLQVITRDVASYQALIDDLLAARIGLKRYFTYIVTKEVKASGLPPLDALLRPKRID
ncbi:Lrp/AsnC family transcriptional regulator [Qingshengfaniella alkalisoli]|uniref:Lrp/AsnC family transcriptional regulator n=1 Tax=Qingshengfaniella alkalisoli TaxID=2599296 RepID=A0A5B8J6Y4_9RHOB|nr:Lrp/AsnC family transcriptional regulator [Qingshengfaniella alkalisoli]QDY70090.1 Lrp/AsnC family transcriptional regulator [Qingshengfaniella alkalisoli]